ncbi:fimbrial isopeptide formation D2 domain-containing protein [Enterococcus hermanniensis]|uniref:Fimbrial isopeptide formation D2 domain-containing protein n=1 Tax=Enterococcus hermanniensis TaxID=249189 RepID=A0A1L8TMS0_9ENTE|nr:fimbrial isopeptide formation D2 domain-containing protein [Enterococcus hermanniensis]
MLVLVGKPIVGHATVTGNTQQITLRKLVFDTLPTEQKNTGDLMEWENSTPLAGAGFTAYDVTADYWAVYDQTSGNKDAKEAAAIAAVKNISTVGKASVVFPNTNTGGTTTLNLPVVSNNKNAIYLFKETTTPAGANAEKSVPFVLGLPVVNADGTNKSTVYLYPKNEYKPTSLTFKKYGVGLNSTGNMEDPKPLANAQFILKEKDGSYYNTTSGKFDATAENASKFTSGSDGSVTAANLILKAPSTYEFYEVDSTIATSASQSATETTEKYHYSKNPVVTAKTVRDPSTSILSVTYDYYDKAFNKQLDKKSAEAYNYLVPQPKKTVDIPDADIGQEVTYTLTQQIPLDIQQYTKFGFIDTKSASLSLGSSDADILNSLKIDGNAVTGVSPTIIKAGNMITINFSPEQLASYAGKTITLNLKMKILPEAALSTELPNTLEFDNNFKIKNSKVAIKTYGKTFNKIDADTKKPLVGAKFVIKKGDLFLKNTNGEISWVASQSDATILTSDANGLISVKGLAQKNGNTTINYALVETAAPEGYVISTKSVHFNADDGTIILEVANKLSGSLPITGGIGLIAFIVSGLAVAGISFIYYLKRRKEFNN